MNEQLVRLLEESFDRINENWSSAIRSTAGVSYTHVPLEDVKSVNRKCLASYLHFIKTGDGGLIEEWNRLICRNRGASGFNIDEIQNALYLFRNVMRDVFRERGLDPLQIIDLNDTIFDTLQVSIVDLSRQFETVTEKRSLSRYFPPAVVDRLLENRDTLHPKKTDLTIFFSDIRGFTKLSEQVELDEIQSILNTYFSRMTDIVFAFEGTIDKFIGDGLMVFFGDPQELGTEEQARRCARMALQMHLAVEELAMSTWACYKDPPLSIGIGINTGEVTVGHIGSERRMDYTAIGRCVNVAARLESVAQGGQILVTEKTLELIRDEFRYEELGFKSLKNVAEPVRVFCVTGRMG